MVPSPSRRSLLAGAAAGVTAVLAGCSASEMDSVPSDDGTLLTEYTAALTRSTGEQPPVVAPREDGGGVDEESSATPDPISLHTIESESGAAELEFAPDATNVAPVRRLVAETAYERESVFVYQTPIGECYRLKLNYVARDGDGDPDFQFCRVIRDADTACERRTRDHAAAFVRLPFPADEYNGYSAGGSSSCDPIPERLRNGSESS